MKNSIKYISIILLAFAALACNKEEASPERPVTKIEMSFQSEGREIDTLSFSAIGQAKEISIVLNNENLKWNVSSDKTWCNLSNSEGKGSGAFTLSVGVNESFSPRDTATITFVAGSYTSPKTLKVIQLGTDFILSQPFFLAAKGGQSWTGITVKSDKDVELNIECPAWISYSVTKESVNSSNVKTTTLKITAEENNGKARTDEMKFSRKGSSDIDAIASFYQFGDELKYDASGNILMPAERDSSFTFTVPNDILDLASLNKGFNKDYIKAVAKPGPEYTTVEIFFENNKNDCMENRTVKNQYITLYNKSRCVIPTIYQPFASCYGINTAQGFLNFAKAVNSGSDISPWMSDGAVHILSNIDMTSVTKSWVSIGTEENPFTGTFDGTYHAISGFVTPNPMFGVCKNATVKAVLLDDSNKYQFSEDPTSETGIAIASVAGKIYGTVLEDCSNSGSVTLNKSVPGENVNIYVAGIVGYADKASTIRKCENFGKVSATADLIATATENTIFVGGIAGHSQCAMTNCTVKADISDASAVRTHYVGGICADLDAEMKGTSMTGNISTASVRDNSKTGVADQSRYVTVGGIAGRTSADISSSSFSGTVDNSSNVKFFYIGGIAGELDAPNLSLADNKAEGSIASSSTVRYLTMGGLYGLVSAEQHINFPTDSEPSKMSFTMNEIENHTASTVCIGGVIGAIKNKPIEIVNAKWSQTVNSTLTKQAHNIYYLSIGGILGGSYNPGGEDSQPAKVTLVNAQNEKGSINITLGNAVSFGARMGCIAGIVGTVNGEALIENCVNTGELFIGAGTTTSGGQANNYSTNMAGIVGRVINGNATINTCSNNGGMRNWTYNNNAWDYIYLFTGNNYSYYTCNNTAGILGSYLGSDNTSNFKLKMKGCTNSGYCYSYRGHSGGIAGAVRDAEIVECTNTGSLGSGKRSYLGGIASLGYNVNISSCTAVCPLTGVSAGSEVFTAGGILGTAQGEGSISSCSYFGDISCDATLKKGEAFGMAIGNTIGVNDLDDPAYTVTSCKFGGKLSGLPTENDSVETDTDNFSDYIFGTSSLTKGGVTVTGCNYWNGK